MRNMSFSVSEGVIQQFTHPVLRHFRIGQYRVHIHRQSGSNVVPFYHTVESIQVTMACRFISYYSEDEHSMAETTTDAEQLAREYTGVLNEQEFRGYRMSSPSRSRSCRRLRIR